MDRDFNVETRDEKGIWRVKRRLGDMRSSCMGKVTDIDSRQTLQIRLYFPDIEITIDC